MYNDEKMDYNTYDTSFLKKKFVKLVVVNKSDSFTFDRLVDRIQNEDIYELKIAENFSEFLGDNVEDHDLDVEDTAQLVNDYVDGIDTDLDKEKIKVNMRELMTEAQALNTV